MVVNLHTGASGSATDTKFLYDAEHGGMLGLYEVFVFTRRPLWFMIFGGVFDRHPDLKVVVTENGVQWLPSLIRDMESFFDTHGGAPVRNYLKMRPRDYFEQHVWLGGSLMKRYEAEMRHEIGIDKLMWGADYPHLEGAAPGPPRDAALHLRRPARGRPPPHPRRQRRRPVGLRRRPAPGGGRPGRPDRRRPGRAARARPTSRTPSAGAWPARCRWWPRRLLGRGRRRTAASASASFICHPSSASAICLRRAARLPGERFAPENGRICARIVTAKSRASSAGLCTTPCLHRARWSWKPSPSRSRHSSRRERPTTATAPPSRSCTGSALASKPSSPRRRRPSRRTRSGRPTGPRRRPRGSRRAVGCPRSAAQAPGAPRAVAAPPARRAPRPGATGRSGSTRPRRSPRRGGIAPRPP